MYITAGACGWTNMRRWENNKEMVTTFKSSLNCRLLVANLSWTWRVQPTLSMIDTQKTDYSANEANYNYFTLTKYWY